MTFCPSTLTLSGSGRTSFFGLKASEVAEMKQKGYKSYEYYVHNPELRAVIDQLNVGFGDGVAYDDIARRLLFGDGGMADQYFLLADFESYREAHQRAGLAYRDPMAWNRMSLMNIARSGIFAADRSIRDYARDIWNVPVREMAAPAPAKAPTKAPAKTRKAPAKAKTEK